MSNASTSEPTDRLRRRRILPSNAFRGALVLMASLANSTLAATPPAWERLAPLPSGHGGLVGGAIDGEIIIAGGTNWTNDTKSWLDQIWAYDPKRNVWRDAGRLPVATAYAATGNDGRTLWFAGGSSGVATHRSVWRIERGLAPQLAAPLDRGFVYAAGATIGTTLYAVGGTDDQAGLERITNTFLAIDLSTGATKRLADYPEASLTTSTAVGVGDRVFVFGGARWDAAGKTVVNHSAAHAYSLARKRWEKLPPLPYAIRGITAVALDPRHVLVAGGYRNDEIEFVANAFVFNVETGTYSPTIPLPYAAMVGLVKSGDWLFCLGGEDRKKHRTDAVYRLRWADLLKNAR